VGFANIVVCKRDGEIVFDPYVDGSCVLTLAEDEEDVPFVVELRRRVPL
jgi:hypothetical protein